MKLGVFLDALHAPLGGAERHTLALLARAVENGDAAVLATMPGGVAAAQVPAGVRTITVDVPKGRPERDRALAENAPGALRAAGADVVLAIRHALTCDVYLPHGGLVDDARAAKDAARGGPSFWTRVGRVFGRKHAFFQDCERALLGSPDGPAVVAVSPMTATRIAQRFPACAERISVVTNGVDAAHFTRAPFAAQGEALRRRHVPSDAFVALLVAHHPALKGAAAAIEALARPEVVADIEPPVHLLLAGGRLEAPLRRRARALGVADRVHELGAHLDPRPVYAAADVLLHPTWYDPCSLVCLEALAMELPVITTPQNGVRDVMGQRGGIVVERPGDPEALAVALRVLAEPELRAFTADDARYLAERGREATRLDQVLEVCRARAPSTA